MTTGDAKEGQEKAALVRLALEKLELVATLILDSAIIAVAFLCRAALLALVLLLAPPENQRDIQNFAVVALELILEFGLVGTAVIHVSFDLAKRIRNSYRSFRA